jgi:hypothetical protein
MTEVSAVNLIFVAAVKAEGSLKVYTISWMTEDNFR